MREKKFFVHENLNDTGNKKVMNMMKRCFIIKIDLKSVSSSIIKKVN